MATLVVQKNSEDLVPAIAYLIYSEQARREEEERKEAELRQQLASAPTPSGRRKAEESLRTHQRNMRRRGHNPQLRNDN